MKRKPIARGISVVMVGLLALVSPAWGDPGVRDTEGVPPMARTLGDQVQERRVLVVEVNKQGGCVRVKEASGRRMNLACDKTTLVVTDDETRADLGFLSPGDIIRVETNSAHPAKLVVLRRAWVELASPEQ